ncbi:MAG: UTP--glucose-1-phosphate uridylyltransferase [Acidobacteria bacterium]|nr:MAG: UTP--glucose-1-phosphate uridylyltransferase [Acidobacteriota bacterium]
MKESRQNTIQAATEKMRASGAGRAAIDTFRHHLEFLLGGASAFLDETTILPLQDLPDSKDFSNYRTAGERLFERTAVIKLNGGLGTSMGLDQPKSLIEVRDGMTFLDLIARQILELRRATGAEIPLLLMNSLGTRSLSLASLQRYPELQLKDLPLDFLQNLVPKIDQETMGPVSFPEQPDFEWCPPGHGDLFTALGASGILDKLLERGIEYVFVCNADNLGAVLSPEILGYMAENHYDFLMEAADRTPADRKGGHLCMIRGEGLALRESAQCPPEESDTFQDIRRYRYFNTNNLWIHLPTLAKIEARFGGVFQLPTILNRKTVDPRNSHTKAVYQLETAMGSAISIFPNATAVRVPRDRFSPVKATVDLLAVRSNAYRLTPDFRIVQDPSRSCPPSIVLDSNYYAMLSDFERHFPSGPPGLLRCTSLEISGEVTFGRNIELEGSVRITAEAPATLPGGHRYSGDFELS